MTRQGSSPFLIGITGRIGAGKSYVAHLLANLYQFPIYDSDHAAKRIVHLEPTRSHIIDLLGPESFKGGAYNNPFVGKAIFQNPDLKHALEQIIHPAVYSDFDHWRENLADESVLLIESALMLQTGFYRKMNTLIKVEASYVMRKQRVLARDPHRLPDTIDQIEAIQAKAETIPIGIPWHAIKNEPGNSLLIQIDQILQYFKLVG